MLEKKVLLVADDDDMNRKVISKFLSKNFTILEAEDGEQVLSILQEKHVDLLLLDIIMPKLDGLSVLKELDNSKAYPHLGILVATSAKEKTERTALSLGADDIVSKPYDPIVIHKRLSNILLIKNKLSKEVHDYSLEEHRAFVKQIQKQEKTFKMIYDVLNENMDNIALRDTIMDTFKKEIETLDTIIATEKNGR